MADLFEMLRRIGLRLSREALDALLTHTQKSRLSPAQLLEQVCTLEQRERDARNLARRSKSASIGEHLPIDKFDWNHPRVIDRQLYESLLTLDFLRRGENVLFRGQAGVGKTSLAQILGLHALAKGHTVRFSTVPAALVDLLRQESLPATERRLKRYTKPALLILDELGYVPCDSRAADLLFNIVSRRHEKRSIVGERVPIHPAVCERERYRPALALRKLERRWRTLQNGSVREAIYSRLGSREAFYHDSHGRGLS
jgi:DNA replication protein DnaC